MKTLQTTCIFLVLLPTINFAQNVGIGTETPQHKLHVVSTVNISGGAAIYSLNSGTVGNAVLGVSNNAGTTAVQGTSNNGIGVMGYTNTNTAMSANAISGTALYASSISGYAMNISGKIKINGGNTNPRDGAVLTSDASGNAVWKTPKIAFSTRGIHSSYRTIPKQTTFRVQFETEEYDYGAKYAKVGDFPSSTSTSEFTAPVSGLYIFNSSVTVVNYSGGSRNDDTRYGFLSLKLNRNGVETELASTDEGYGGSGDMFWTDKNWSFMKEVKLQAGDRVYVTIWIRNDDSDETLYLSQNATYSWFTGRLIWED